MDSESCGTSRGIRGKEDRMRRIVDLTLPIEEHWRYGIKFEEIMSFAKGDPWQVTSSGIPLVHAHRRAPAFRGRRTLAE